MVASTVEILPIYLDCTERDALSGGVSNLEDDTAVHESDNRLTTTNERSERARQTWQLSWTDALEDDAKFIWDLFRLARNSKGFLFISPLDEERVYTAQPIRNTVTGANTGDGSTTTFQLQITHTLDYDVGAGSETLSFDVNYPLAGTATVYANGVAATISSISLLTGVVTLSVAPANGAAMTADFSRAVPVIATSKNVARTLLEGQRSEVRSLQIKEIL